MPVTRSANAKFILFGEHAVVYGVPAIAGGITNAIRVTVNPNSDSSDTTSSVSIPAWDLTFFVDATSDELLQRTLLTIVNALGLQEARFHLHIDADIAPASGLGASAALAVATIRALSACYGLAFDDNQINALAFQTEKLAHGNPSGLDNTLATFGGLQLFQRQADSSPSLTPLSLAEPLPLLIAHSGKKGFTADTVARVKRQKDAKPNQYKALFADIASIVDSAKLALKNGDFTHFAHLMTENQRILRTMGVSCDEIEQLIRVGLNAGAVGAKLTGSGDGGSVILYAGEATNKVFSALNDQGFKVFKARLAAT